MRVKLQKVGNELHLQVPEALAKQADLLEGEEVELTVSGGSLRVTPIGKGLTLDEMLDQITEENRHDAIDWGPPVGREAW